jgi:UDP-N-acetylglucosamine 2-epimerase (non-hydrolysing)
MPEEKFRTMIDHLSDVIYTYEEEYKLRGVAEGLNPSNIVVVRNPIVDILNEFYFKDEAKFKLDSTDSFFAERHIKKGEYYLMTCHRRENVHIRKSFDSIMKLVESSSYPIFFPASYRTQRVMKEYGYDIVKNLLTVDPVGYQEMLKLIVNSRGVLTDSGTVPEECSVLNVPCVQMRKATERPQVYDVGGCVKFDPDRIDIYPPKLIYKKLESLNGKTWTHVLGDGKSSERIANDLILRVRGNKLRGHLYENNHLPIQRSLREDGLESI